MSTTSLPNHMQRHMAFAALCQAAGLVKKVARADEYSATAFSSSIHSVAMVDAESTEQIYGGLSSLEFGFSTLVAQLDNQSENKDIELTRYVANLIGLERKLSSSNQTLQALGSRINDIQRQQLHLDLLDRQMLSNLASIYSDVISPLGNRIQVSGDPEVLKQSDNQNKVRALLLAGLRAAILWRQLGGRRRQILFSRQSIVTAAKYALHQIRTTH